MNQPQHNQACRVTVHGVVQGVGFRPFVYRLAAQHHIAGWVRNVETGVEIHAEGQHLDAFLDEIRSEPPPAAKIAGIDCRDAAPQGCESFQIRNSFCKASPTVRVSPDLAVCAECLQELNDPEDFRFGYAYINCTHCGPRYSIIRRLPYDRANTTMESWELCERCHAEYRNPLNRRYHAQPTACQRCGPQYYLVEDSVRIRAAAADPKTETEKTTDEVSGRPSAATALESCDDGSHASVVERAAALLRQGRLLAVKGIGGYHLACDATNAVAVEELRSRKFRKEKPFAVMVRDLEQARRLAALTPSHEKLLGSVARPIVIAPATADLPGVAPGSADLGIMLPYAPLHHLLFQHGAPSPLVLTSANRSNEPIAYLDEDARSRLSGIADAFLIGQRPIARRVDDSVVAVRGGQPFTIRRSRGFAPSVVARMPARSPILALGADLKNAIALLVGGEVLVSQHIGDLQEDETRSAFEETVRDLLDMYEIDPAELTVAHDLHPQFHSTRFAGSLPCRRRVAVQHHHAHAASVLAEHELLEERVVAVTLDGTGYGSDGTIWGGEIFVGSLRHGFARHAWLRPFQLPGGDAAARFPVQAAAGLLAQLTDLPDMTKPPFDFPERYGQAASLVARQYRCFPSTSTGRLFDAVAAVAGFVREVTFEGQAAIWLETVARRSRPQPPYPFPDLDFRPCLQFAIDDRRRGRDPAEIAFAFHAGLAHAVAQKVIELATQHEVSAVALTGGVFQNELLFDLIVDELQSRKGPRIVTNREVPVNDGGICLGQAALAAVSITQT